MLKKLLYSLLLLVFYSITAHSADIVTGAAQTERYLPLLKDKKVALVVNPSSRIGSQHLVDSLIALNIAVELIFTPEHGFRGDADAGEELSNSTDQRTGIAIHSLYGKQFKPSPESMENIDIIIFDIQDVGTRCYTYLSTLHYVMEACAEAKKKLIVFDRPNPNGFYVDGPVLDTAFSSFVGLHPIPLVYGMTIGEYSKMINGEKWLKNGIQCDLEVISMQEYTHRSSYTLPVKPSPNLNSQESIYLYPSLCLFEGTAISMGRGTMLPFRQLGHPKLNSAYRYSFIPKTIPGMSKNPPYEGKQCYGISLKAMNTDYFMKQNQIDIHWLIELYGKYPDKPKYFNAFFKNLAGTDQLQKQIEAGLSEKEIRASWQPHLREFKQTRSKYLLYK